MYPVRAFWTDFKDKLSEGYNEKAPHHTHQNWHGYNS